jgi:TolB-like protein/tetratricopeptide (TPR) repeat protein
MRAGRSALKGAIESVADGSPDIDWERFEQQAGTDDDLDLLRQLRVVSRLSAIHRAEIEHIDEQVVLASADSIARLRTKMATPDGETGASHSRDQAERPPTLPIPAWGRLQLRERLGEGSFGEVYRAFDPQLEREVAVKLLHVGKPKAMSRVLAEARALARVRHPNVVVVHDAEAHDGRVGLCMEFIRGQTLASLLKAHGKLGATEATSIGQALCRALAAVHNQGLLHRDIKAHNVMREEGGRVVLMDFGTGQRRELAGQGQVRLAGTPLYLAPEVLAGGHATVQSDIYSLGVLLYHLVTNSYPVEATSLDELAQLHKERRVTHLHDRRPDLSEAFVQIVERALEHDAAKRYASAGEMQAALQLTYSLRTITDPTPSWRTRAGRWASLAALMAVLIGVAVMLNLGGRRFWLIGGPSDGRPVIAVLPFAAGGELPEYVASDVTDAIHQALASLKGVRVVSHRSSAVAQRAGTPLPALADALGASEVLEGRVTRAGGGLALSFQLVRAQTDHTLLAQSVPFTPQSFSQLQHQIIQLVSQALDISVPVEVSSRFAPGRAENADARDLYARARFELFRNSATGKDRAIDLFEHAIALDPGFALARSGLARAYWTTTTFKDISGAYEQAERAALDAIALDDSISEAHTILADIKMARDWDWSAAEAGYQKAVAFNPSFELAQERYAMLMAARGRTADAVSRIAEARRIDPLSAETLLAEATVLQYAGRFQEALTQAGRAEHLRPDNPAVYVVRGRVLAALGRHAEARTAFVRASELDTTAGRDYIEAELATLDAVTGRRTEAMATLARLEAKALNGELDSTMVALLHGRLGDLSQGFVWLDRALTDRSSRLVWIKVDPRFKPFRTDPRFAELVQRIGI